MLFIFIGILYVTLSLPESKQIQSTRMEASYRDISRLYYVGRRSSLAIHKDSYQPIPRLSTRLFPETLRFTGISSLVGILPRTACPMTTTPKHFKAFKVQSRHRGKKNPLQKYRGTNGQIIKPNFNHWATTTLLIYIYLVYLLYIVILYIIIT